MGDYLIGEKIDINGNGTPLRYMDKPSKDGASPDCWSTNTKNLDPHYSSGPLNHWFYLASEGRGAKTINGVAYNSTDLRRRRRGDRRGPGQHRQGLVPHAVHEAHVRQHLRQRPQRRHRLGQGALRSHERDVYGGREGVHRDLGPGWLGDLWRHHAPAHRRQPAAEPRLRVRGGSWTGTAGPITSNTGRPARTGSWKMWLGGNGSTSTETEQQSVTIPSTATSATLSFWLRTDTAESGSTAYDTMRVQVVDGATTSTLATYSNVGTNSTYTQKSFNVTAYKGRTISVKFLMNEDSTLQTSFVVDDTAVSVS